MSDNAFSFPHYISDGKGTAEELALAATGGVVVAGPLIEKIKDRDRRSFERRRKRQHMIRRAYPGEVFGAPPAKGRSWFVAVHKISEAMRWREFFIADSALETDLSDSEVLAVLAQVDASRGDTERAKFRTPAMADATVH
jgi:hypothetical protein